jgi:hypothetical protein
MAFGPVITRYTYFLFITIDFSEKYDINYHTRTAQL